LPEFIDRKSARRPARARHSTDSTTVSRSGECGQTMRKVVACMIFSNPSSDWETVWCGAA
jgi:hypothetical protein